MWSRAKWKLKFEYYTREDNIEQQGRSGRLHNPALAVGDRMVGHEKDLEKEQPVPHRQVNVSSLSSWKQVKITPLLQTKAKLHTLYWSYQLSFLVQDSNSALFKSVQW